MTGDKDQRGVREILGTVPPAYLLFRRKRLQIRQAGGEVRADHVVHVHEDAHDLADVRRGAVHRPDDVRGAADPSRISIRPWPASLLPFHS